MKSDEYLILMNLGRNMLQGSPVLSLDDRKRIRSVGIQTAVEYPEWADIEPAQGIYDYSSIENALSTNRAAEMKTIFSVFNPWIPAWIPDEWRPKYESGVYNTAFLSIWNKEAIEYRENLIYFLVNTYDAEDVMFIQGDVDTGESVLPSYAWYDDCAIKDFGSVPNFEDTQTKEWLEKSAIEYYVRTQKILYPQFKEIWNAHQWLISKKNPASCNYAQPKLLETYRKEFQDLSLVLLQYTYFDDSHPQENVAYVDMLKDTYNCEVIAEAMFCKGFPTTAPKSIAKGFRGQIICPTHPHTSEKRLEGWMVEEISNAHKLWNNSKT